MCVHTLRKQSIFALCVMALGGLALADKPAGGGGGGGGGGTVPPGTIYFSSDGTSWSMNGDGSEKTPAITGKPSYQTQGGSRWFLQTVFLDWEEHTDLYGDLTFWRVDGIVAVDETGYTVPLGTVRGFDVGDPIWGKDDSFISFTSAVAPEDGIGGLFVMEVDWSSGEPSPGTTVLALEGQPDPYSASQGDVALYPKDWSPAGDQLVFCSPDADGYWMLQVATFSTAGVETNVLVSAGNAIRPYTGAVWSPNGSRIAFARTAYLAGWYLDEIWTVNPNGTGAARLTQASVSRTTRIGQQSPTWSPDGAFIAYAENVSKKNNSSINDVKRIPSSGGATSSLTSDGRSAAPQWRL